MSNLISLSVGLLLTNQEGNLFMLKESDGWGIPAGKMEIKDFFPSRAIRREFTEETSLALLGPLILAGLTLILRPTHLSLGIIFRSTQDISQYKFTPVSQALELIVQKAIRKPEYNLPALSAWLTNSFIISLGSERG